MDNAETMARRATQALNITQVLDNRSADYHNRRSVKFEQALRNIIAIVDDVERRGHALNELDNIRLLAQQALK